MSRDSFRSEYACADPPSLPFTGERIVPGRVAEHLFREHEIRYLFASEVVKGMLVVDVACGSGIGTDYLLKAGARSCLGLDIDSATLDYAIAAYNKCSFAQCDATNLCLPDGSVDAVVSFETIEHVKDQKVFLLECKRVLKTGGILVCSTPNRATSQWLQKNPFHVHELGLVEFAELLGSMFIDVKLYAQQSKIYPWYVARKLVLKLLDSVGVKELVMKILRPSAAVASRTEFDANPDHLRKEIRPYVPSSLVQPLYVIAVARKPSV
jgi:2-polyprenyl-3-methyl-5-hydroxy-6-metoxy-1,4-benzoquinol methylase